MGLERKANALYASRTHADQQAAVGHVKDVFDAASRNHISLRLGYASGIFMGRNEVSRWHPIKRRKLRKIEKALQKEQDKREKEQTEGARLQDWLKSDSTVPLTLSWHSTGREYMQTPSLVKTEVPEGQFAERAFALGSTLSLPYELLDGRLDHADRDKLQAREAFWKRYDINTGQELQEFLIKNFKRTTIDFGEKLPVEMRWLEAAYPDDFAYLKTLKEEHGLTIELVKSVKAPNAVGDSIRSVATGSYRGFVSPWFKSFVREGKEPLMLDSDRELLAAMRIVQKTGSEAIRTGDTKIRRRLHIKPKPIVADVKDALIDHSYEKKLDHDKSLGLIRDFVPLSMSLSVTDKRDGSYLSDEVRTRVEAINTRLGETIGKDYAAKRLSFEDSQSVSKKSVELLTWTLGVAGVSTVLEALHAGPVAKFIAASSDDVINEAAALASLSIAEDKTVIELLKKRAKFLGPVLGSAMALAAGVDWIKTVWGDRIGGAAFMIAATMLSGATVLTSGYGLAKNYAALAREGKIPDYYPIIPEEAATQIKEKLQQAEAEPLDIKQATWNGIAAFLQQHGEDEKSIAQKQHLFDRFAQGKEAQKIFDQIKNPSWLASFAHGLKEATVINPSGGFILGASVAAPFVGLLLGPFFLANPLLYATAGSLEGQTGVVGALAHRGWFSKSWEKQVERKIKDLQN